MSTAKGRAAKPAPPPERRMIDSLTDLVKAVEVGGFFRSHPDPTLENAHLYCPNCGDIRRVRYSCIYRQRVDRHGDTPKELLKLLTPSLWWFQCLDCRMPSTAAAYEGPDGPSLAIFPKLRGGLRTTHTPDGVAYYLDQASRAESVGARSAAMAMYRAALDQLLFDQGFTDGMTGQKVFDLRLGIDVAKGVQQVPTKRKKDLPTAPAWTHELDTEFLELLSQLGSGAIHTNDGDVSKQAILDAALLQRVRTAFRYLLFLAYEVDHQKQEALSEMRAGAQVLKRPSAGKAPSS